MRSTLVPVTLWLPSLLYIELFVLYSYSTWLLWFSHVSVFNCTFHIVSVWHIICSYHYCLIIPCSYSAHVCSALCMYSVHSVDERPTCKMFSSAELDLGSPLSSYLEEALYKYSEWINEWVGQLIFLYLWAGQPIDSPLNGRAPLPWHIHCYPNQMFHDEIHLIEVPHTAAVTVSPPLQQLVILSCVHPFMNQFRQWMNQSIQFVLQWRNNQLPTESRPFPRPLWSQICCN